MGPMRVLCLRCHPSMATKRYSREACLHIYVAWPSFRRVSYQIVDLAVDEVDGFSRLVAAALLGGGEDVDVCVILLVVDGNLEGGFGPLLQ